MVIQIRLLSRDDFYTVYNPKAVGWIASRKQSILFTIPEEVRLLSSMALRPAIVYGKPHLGRLLGCIIEGPSVWAPQVSLLSWVTIKNSENILGLVGRALLDREDCRAPGSGIYIFFFRAVAG